MKRAKFLRARSRRLGRAVMSLESLESRQLMAAVKVMPLGDSITEGLSGHNSYRQPLWNMLAQAGYSVDFVGGMTGIQNGLPPKNNFDENHEGHTGFLADQVRDNTVAWANANKPDVVLLHIGSNDIINNQTNASTATEIGQIIDNLRSVVPNVKILLAQIIPSTINQAMFSDLNAQIATLASTKTTAQSPITLVDQYTGFSTSNLYDGIHPDSTGEQQIATKWYNALTGVLPAPTPPPPGTYLSDLNATSSSNGWGSFEQNRSNGEVGAADGRMITLNGVQYMYGLGVHANSDITYNIAGQGFTEFNSDIGIDDESGNSGSVTFQVFVNGSLAYTSPTLTGASSTISIPAINVTGASTLRLVVNGGTDVDFDHADWANPRLFAAAVIPAPTAPTGLGGSYNTGTSKVDLNWTDASGDETGFRIDRKIGAGGTYAQIADLPAGTQTYSDALNLVSGTTYYYRIYAYKTGASNSGYSNEFNLTIPVAPGTINLSSLPFLGTPVNGWGPIEKDKSNGENGTNDGRTITLNGQTFTTGLGVHANSDASFALNGQYTQFNASIGVDDEAGNGGSVIFRVYFDGSATPAYESPLMTGTSTTIPISLNVTNVNTLRLVVNNNGGSDLDHADWAGAQLVAGQPVTPPGAPTLGATLNDEVDLTWTDPGNETSFRVQRKLGSGGVWADIATNIAANTLTYADTSVLQPSSTYYYRVFAHNAGGDSLPSNEAFITTPAGATVLYIGSDVPYTVTSNGWGPAETNRSNGEQGAADGKQISLATLKYNHGIGVHANSDISVALNGQYSQFLSDIGIDDEVGNTGSVIFRVYLDGASTPIYESPTLTGASSTITIPAINVTGVNTLRLVVNNAGGSDFDHADWADARLIPAGPVTPPTAPSSLTGSYNGSTGKIDLNWIDASNNETGFRVERKTGAGGTWASIATPAAGATSYSDSGPFTSSTTYYYRVYSVIGGTSSTSSSNEYPVTTPLVSQQVWLSDLNWQGTPVNGWGPPEKNKSNGEAGANDGKTLSIRTNTYTKGIGVHANSDITYNLGGAYQSFTTDYGIDNETNGLGSVIFRIYFNGSSTPAWESGTVTGSSPVGTVGLSVAGVNTLRLVVNNAGNSDYDHADWAGAKLDTAPNTAPNTPVITEPVFDGEVVNPADVHMEAPGFSDPDGDTHASSDWEIRVASTNALVWQAYNITGVEKVHIHLGDGQFVGGLAGKTELDQLTNYIVRVRQRDSRGAYSDWAVRQFSTSEREQISPLELEDVLSSPTPTWTLNTGGAGVELPVGTSLLLSGPGGDVETLLKLDGQAATGNAITNPADLAGHVDARIKITATSAAINIGASNLTFTEDSGEVRTIYLPAVTLSIGQTAYFWISLDGSTYVGNSGQTQHDFTTPARLAPVPFVASQPGYQIDVFAGGFQLPTNIVFVPNPGPNPTDVKFYVTELYGTIKAVENNGAVVTYASNLLNFNPTGSFPGSGEQGLAGIVVDPTTGDVFASMVYSSQAGVESAPHYPKVVRFHSTDGGHTAATQTTVIQMPGETMGQSHFISNLTIGPSDGKLYVHVGDGFDTTTPLNMNSFRGKILRMNLDGTPVTTNPFYNAADGINAKDFIFAYGVRNPFGGAWRALDGQHYEVENGPTVDRLAKITAGTSYGYNGSDASMAINAIYNWNPAHAPTNLTFIQSATFGGSGFPADKMDHLFVAESGPTYATGPQALGKRITEFTLDANGNRISGPTNFVTYNGTGKGTVVGLAAGPDGLYFTELYKDLNAATPIDAGARIFRVRYTG